MCMYSYRSILAQEACWPPRNRSYSLLSALWRSGHRGRHLEVLWGALIALRGQLLLLPTFRYQFEECTPSLPTAASFELSLITVPSSGWVREGSALPRMPSSKWYWQWVWWWRGPMNRVCFLRTAKHSSNIRAQDLKLVKAKPRLQTKLLHREVAAHLVAHSIDLFSL